MVCRFSLRPKRAARQAGTQQGACRFRNLQSGTQHSWPEQIQSPAVLCTEMLPARIVQAETRAGTTATVYQTLFGCPPEFAAIADVVPESQGASLTNLDTPSDIGNMQTTPTSLFAFSVLTEKSDVPFLKNSADTHQVSNNRHVRRPAQPTVHKVCFVLSSCHATKSRVQPMFCWLFGSCLV